MTHFATLIATKGLDAATVARARAALPQAAEPAWLGADIAADIPFTAPAEFDNRALADHVRLAIDGAPVDVVVQPAADRRKMLFLADMDSTMIGQECIDELADFAGLKAHVAEITARAMRGEIEFAPALRERVALLKGLPASVVDEVIRERITLTPGGKALVATMRKHGAHTCLVTGGFTLFGDRIAKAVGFDETRANTLVLDGDRFAGTVTEPIFGREGKLQTLLELRSRYNVGKAQTMAIGDGANDLAMIQEAGLGVAVHAKPLVAAAAAARIDHSDLTALLYAQGYRKDEFVEP